MPITRQDNRFAATEKKAGERAAVVNALGYPTNAHSVGIFKGLQQGSLGRSFGCVRGLWNAPKPNLLSVVKEFQRRSTGVVPGL